MIEAKLIVVGGDAKRSEVNLKSLPATIGRAKEASITLPHALVSRQHCEIYEENDRLCVKDLNSLNGTYLNNQKINGSATLLPGQLLTLGNVTFRADYSLIDGSGSSVSSGFKPTTASHLVEMESGASDADQSDVDTDHGVPQSDTDRHIFAIDDETLSVDKSISLGAVADLPQVTPQASFTGELHTDQDQTIQVDPGEVRIQLSENESRSDPSQSSLDEFFRKNPK